MVHQKTLQHFFALRSERSAVKRPLQACGTIKKFPIQSTVPITYTVVLVVYILQCRLDQHEAASDHDQTKGMLSY